MVVVSAMQTEKILQHAVREKLAVTLVINKIDRLVLELKLPPVDAYYKLMHTIEEVNNIISSASSGRVVLSFGCPVLVSLLLKLVGGLQMATCSAFLQSSATCALRPAKMRGVSVWNPLQRCGCLHKGLRFRAVCECVWSLSVTAFPTPQMYCQSFGPHGFRSVDHKRLAKRLWGDVWFHPETRKFVTSQPHVTDADGDDVAVPRTFVQFVLEPIYKIYAQVLGEEPDVLNKTLQSIGVVLKRSELHFGG
jgi:116 kDa U5 small nuclear ribonucleoprotein component